MAKTKKAPKRDTSAKKGSSSDKPIDGRVKRAKYPWDKWFARKTLLKITHGKDFDCQPHSMAQQIRNVAFRRKAPYPTIKIEGDTLNVRFK